LVGQARQTLRIFLKKSPDTWIAPSSHTWGFSRGQGALDHPSLRG